MLAFISNMFSGDGLMITLIVILLFGIRRFPALWNGHHSARRKFSKAEDDLEHELDAEPRNMRYGAVGRIAKRPSIYRRLSVWLSPVPAFQPIS